MIGKSRELVSVDLKGLSKKGLLREDKKGKKFIYYIEGKTLKEKLDSIAR